MFSEKIDIAANGIKAYAQDLKTIIRDICNAIAKYGKNTVSVDYYTESEIANWTFRDYDRDGYGLNIYVSGIERIDTREPIFRMRSDSGAFCERDVDDFDEAELIWLSQMMNDLYDVIEEDKSVVEMPKRQFRF